jgi:hypothetical protein
MIGGICVAFSADKRPESPPAELERFAWMIGDWETAATYRFLPDLPTLELQSTETIRWSTNKQFMITEEEGMTPEGWRAKLIVTAWDEKRRAYRMVDVDLTGEVTELSMTMENDVRKIVYYRNLGERRIRSELTVTRLSDVEYRTRGECSDLSKIWICYDSISKKRTNNTK